MLKSPADCKESTRKPENHFMKIIKLVLIVALNWIASTAFGQGVWTQKADIPYFPRARAYGFAVGNQGYLGGGHDDNGEEADGSFEFNPATNTWTDANGSWMRYDALGFTIGDKGYTGFELWGTSTQIFEYDFATGFWSTLTSFSNLRDFPTAVSIGDKAYFGLGEFDNTKYKDWYEYDLALDFWNQLSDYPGTGNRGLIAFSIGDKGYVGLGAITGSTPAADFWEYDPANDTWTRKADFPGGWRDEAVAFVIGNRGYVGTGKGASVVGQGNLKNDLWEYNPFTDSWTQMADMPAAKRCNAVAFAIDGKGYVGTGGTGGTGPSFTAGTTYGDFWEFTPPYNTTGIDKSENLKVEICPNPATSYLTIETKNFNGEQIQFQCFDSFGKIVQEFSLEKESTTIDLAYLPAGVHFYSLQKGESVQNGKFTIIR